MDDLTLSPSYRGEFAEHPLYLNHASYGPPSRSVLDTVESLGRAAMSGASSAALHAEDARARAAVAPLVGCPPERIALTTSTSQGLLQTAFGVSGTVLVSLEEFPANVYPWLRAQDAGRLRVRPLPGSGAGEPIAVTPERVADALTPEVTALVVSAVDFRSGYRADLDGLREALGPDRLLIVDGIQGFGVVDQPWEAADVLAVGAQKWLRAGWGSAFVAYSERGLAGVAPALGGWTGVEDPLRLDGRRHADRRDASRYSVSSVAPAASGALASSLELLGRGGLPAVAAAIADRVARLGDAIEAAGLELLSPADPTRRAGIVVAGGSSERIGAIAHRLEGEGATITRHGPDRLRFSPHATTTDDAIARIAELLALRE